MTDEAFKEAKRLEERSNLLFDCKELFESKMNFVLLPSFTSLELKDLQLITDEYKKKFLQVLEEDHARIVSEMDKL